MIIVSIFIIVHIGKNLKYIYGSILMHYLNKMSCKYMTYGLHKKLIHWCARSALCTFYSVYIIKV